MTDQFDDPSLYAAKKSGVHDFDDASLYRPSAPSIASSVLGVDPLFADVQHGATTSAEAPVGSEANPIVTSRMIPNGGVPGIQPGRYYRAPDGVVRRVDTSIPQDIVGGVSRGVRGLTDFIAGIPTDVQRAFAETNLRAGNSGMYGSGTGNPFPVPDSERPQLIADSKASLNDALRQQFSAVDSTDQFNAKFPVSNARAQHHADMTKAKGFGGVAKAILSSPLQTSLDMVESLGPFIPSIVAGTLNPGAGAATGAATMSEMESQRSAVEYLRERGIPLDKATDQDIQDALRFANARAGVMAAAGLLPVGRLARIPLGAAERAGLSPALHEGANLLLGTGAAGAQWGGAEAAAEAATGQDLDAARIAQQAITMAGQHAASGAHPAMRSASERNAAGLDGVTTETLKRQAQDPNATNDGRLAAALALMNRGERIEPPSPEPAPAPQSPTNTALLPQPTPGQAIPTPEIDSLLLHNVLGTEPPAAPAGSNIPWEAAAAALGLTPPKPAHADPFLDAARLAAQGLNPDGTPINAKPAEPMASLEVRPKQATAPESATALTPSETNPARAQPVPAPVASDRTDVTKARGALNVQMGGNEFPVSSIEDASAKFLQMRDQLAGDLGGMPVVKLVDQQGRPVAHIGHNGEVYEGLPSGKVERPIYDPHTPNRYGADVLPGEFRNAGTVPREQAAIEPPALQKPARARSAAKAEPSVKKPVDLLEAIARNGGLNRDAFRAFGVDPAEFTRRAGFHYVFRKNGGMRPDDLREWMQQEGYLQADHPDRPSEVDANDAFDLFDRAFRSGDRIYPDGQGDHVASYEAQRRDDMQGPDEHDAIDHALSGELGYPDSTAMHDAFANERARQEDRVDDMVPEGYNEARSLGELFADPAVRGMSEDEIGRILQLPEADQARALWKAIDERQEATGHFAAADDRGHSGRDEGSGAARGNEQADGVREDTEPFTLEQRGADPQEVTRRPAQSGQLFGEPTARDHVDAAGRTKDVERNGRNAEGRTDMAAGDGELFSGDRPEQGRIESSRDMFASYPKDGETNGQQNGNGRGDDYRGQPGASTHSSGDVGRSPDYDAATSRRGQLSVESIVRRLGGTPIADSINRAWNSDGRAGLTGRRLDVSSPEATAREVAFLSEAARNPAVETLRYFFLDDAGNVLGETAVSMREVSSSRIFPGTDDVADGMAWLKGAMPEGTTKLWMQHNHPTGDPKASKEDVQTTLNMSSWMRQHIPGVELAGHVIIDHTVFGHIKPDGDVQPIGNIPRAGPDPTRVITGNGTLLGNMSTPGVVARIATHVRDMNGENSVGVIHADASGLVNTITSIPVEQLATKKGLGVLSRMARKSGGEYIALTATPEVIAKYRDAISKLNRSGIAFGIVEVHPDGSIRQLSEARLARNNFGNRSMGRANMRSAHEVREGADSAHVEIAEGDSPHFDTANTRQLHNVEPRRPGESQPDYLRRLTASTRNDMRAARESASRQKEIGRAGMRAMLATQARLADRADAVFSGFRKHFDKAGSTSNLDAINQWETGQEVTDPNARAFFGLMDQLFADRIARLRAAKPEAMKELIENYFPHIWKDTAKAEAWYAQNTKRPLDGDKSFLKQRMWGTTRAGMESGLRPVSMNPADLALLKLQQMDKFITFNEFKNDLHARGWLKTLDSGERIPEGYATIDGPAFKQPGKQVVVPAVIAKDVNNYLAPSLYRYGAWKSLRYVQNVLMSSRLGWSAFHAGFTTTDNLVMHLDVAGRRMMEGDIARGLALLAKSPATALLSPFEGGALNKEWRGQRPSALSQRVFHDPHTAAILDALQQGGARRLQNADHMDYNNSLGKAIRKVRQLTAPGELQAMLDRARLQSARNTATENAKAIAKAPAAAMAHILSAVGEASSYLIHQKLVPAQKMAARVMLLKFELDHFAEQLGKERGDYTGILSAMHPDAIKQIAGKVVNLVDDRLGQMNYDNQFWNKTAREVSQAFIGAVGWQVGTVRTVTGGVADLRRLWSPEKLLAPLDRAGTLNGAEFSRVSGRLTYLLSLGLTMGGSAAALQYLLTGQGPQELKDYFFPKTGRKNDDDSDERLQFPSYWMDHYKLGSHPIQTASHKLHPSIGMMIDLWKNEDFFGTRIRDKDAAWSKQAEQVGKYVAKSFVPYSVTGQQKLDDANASTTQRVGNFIGVTNAPKSVSRTDFQAFVAEKAAERLPKGTRTPEQKAHSDRMHQVEADMRRGNTPDMTGLTPKEQENARKASQQLVPAIRFKRLGIGDKIKAWDLATPQERDRYSLRDIILGTYKGDMEKAVSKLPLSDQQDARDAIDAIRGGH